MKAHTKETQATMTPQKALQFLKEGNQRFQKNTSVERIVAVFPFPSAMFSGID